MPSDALIRWRTGQAAALDQIQAAHSALEGGGPGRRYRTKQLNGAYVVLLTAHFQDFCRNLHSEAALFVASTSPNSAIRDAILAGLTQDRFFDRGNAQPSSLAKDFRRFKMELWTDVENRSPKNKLRKKNLEQLNVWRNAVAHQDFGFDQGELKKIGKTKLNLRFVRRWRGTCNALAAQFDAALQDHLRTIVGASPW